MVREGETDDRGDPPHMIGDLVIEAQIEPEIYKRFSRLSRTMTPQFRGCCHKPKPRLGLRTYFSLFSVVLVQDGAGSFIECANIQRKRALS